MKIEFRSILEYPKGTLVSQLKNAYSFDLRFEKRFGFQWEEYDDFFYSNPNIAKKYGFITVVDGKPVGHISWDPRNLDEYVEVGHNCILCEYKGLGLGHIQLEEAIRRIRLLKPKRVTVFTNECLLPAINNYQSVGFKLIRKRENTDSSFAGMYLDYEINNNK